MKKLSLIFAILCAFCLGSSAQDSSQEFRERITKADFYKKAVPDSLKYYLPQFEAGRVFFKDGGWSNGLFNIDTYKQKLLFIDTDGSMKAIADGNDVVKVLIGHYVFYKYNGQYVSVVDQYQDVIVLVSKSLEFKDREKTGAFGLESETTAIQNYGTLYSGGQYYDLDQFHNMNFSLKTYPYLFYQEKFYPMTKANLVRFLPSKRKVINAHIRAKHTDFKKIEDVEKLFEALNQSDM